jgi:hypothetical protein
LADSQPFSVTKLLAGLGGALLIASFFLPLLDTSRPDAKDAFGIGDLRRQIEATSNADLVRPMIEPAMQSLERFATSPSLKNLTDVAGQSGTLLNTAANAGAAEAAEMRKVAGILGWVRLGLWLLPLVGLVQLALPLVTRLRGYTGFFGLVGRFVFGWLFLLMALVPVLGADGKQDLIGPAVWVLLAGSSLMIVASLFGGTRRNWWAVVLVDIGLIAATFFALATFAGR